MLWLVFVLSLYIIWESYFSLLILLSTLILFVLQGFSVIYLKNRVRFLLDTPGAVEKHEPVFIDVIAENLSLLPIARLKVFVLLENQLTGRSDEKEIVFTLNSKTPEKIPIEVDSNYCGKITVHLKQMAVFDWFGFYSKHQSLDETGSFYVLPNQFPVKLHAAHQVVDTTDNQFLPYAKKGDTDQEIIDIREYIPGDHVRHVHWKLTGKYDELIIKEISDASHPTYLILFETSLFESGTVESPEVRDAAVEALFSISEALLKNGDPHMIGWLNQENGELQFADIYKPEDLGTSLQVLLAIKKEHRSESTIGAFVETKRVVSFSHVIYVTTEQSVGFLDRLAIPANMSILNCKENDIITSRQREVVFTPENVEAELRQLSI